MVHLNDISEVHDLMQSNVSFIKNKNKNNDI
jgi:hypothetical protein